MRTYQALLFLCPTAFRNEYGTEMAAVFARRRREASNVLAWLWLWLETVCDVAVTAAQAHLDILRQDVRDTLRSMRRAPAFAATVIAVTALGIGATTAAFSIADHVFLRPLPYADSGRLVTVWQSFGEYNEMELSPLNYRDWKRMNNVFESMAAYHGLAANLSGDGPPLHLEGVCVTADVLPLLGVKPALGRLFSAEDDHDGASKTLILSDSLWRSRFGADPAVLNRKVILDDAPYTVIGVMPPNFFFPRRDVAMWAPMQFAPEEFSDRTDYYLNVVAKLAPGVTRGQALAGMKVVAAQLEKQYPRENAHVSASIVGFRDMVSEKSRILLIALVAASLCLLLIACTNLANLLLARSMIRRKEIAVRTALGAGRERLVRQLLTESLLLAFAGGVLGVFLAFEAAPLLVRLVPSGLPIAETPPLDVRVLAIAAAMTILTGVGFGTLPAVSASRSGVAGLQEGSRSGVGGRRERLRGLLVAGQVACSVALLVSCGLLIRALWRVEATDPGFRTAGVLTLQTALPMPKYDATSKRVRFYDQVLGGIRSLPGVESAGFISFLPMSKNRGGVWTVAVDGEPRDPAHQDHASVRFATPDFLRTMGIPLMAGRDISNADTIDTLPVAVVSQSFVRRYWPQVNPLGHHFRLQFQGEERTVVGVAGNVRVRGLERNSEPQVYMPYKQMKDGQSTWYAPKDLAVRAASDPISLLPAIRQIIAAADPEQPISEVQTLSDLVAADAAPRAVQVRVLGGFALLSFLLAALGIHGLLSFMVSSRAPEIGVRIAVGAQARNIMGLVLGEGAALCGIGILAGLLLAWAAGQSLRTVLADVNPLDPLTFLTGFLLGSLMTLGGSLLPALRAIHVDPIVAIRSE
jgi:predicted permease